MPDENKDDLRTVVEMLAKQQETTNNMLASMGQNQAQQSQMMTQMAEKLAGGLSVTMPPAKDETLQLTEESTPQDVANYLLAELKGATAPVNEELRNEIAQLKQTVVRGDREAEIQSVQAAKGNEDFESWLPEMKELATRNPTLEVAELLVLARTKNPEKMATINAEMEAQRAKDNPVKQDTFTGLTPTSTDVDDFGASTEGETEKFGSFTEAARAAYESLVPNSAKASIESEDASY